MSPQSHEIGVIRSCRTWRTETLAAAAAKVNREAAQNLEAFLDTSRKAIRNAQASIQVKHHFMPATYRNH